LNETKKQNFLTYFSYDNVLTVPCELHACKQKFEVDENNPRIPRAAVTNFKLTLASAKENFPA